MTIQNYKDRHYELEWENLGIRGCIVLNNMNGNLRYEESDNENGKDFDDKEKSRMTFMTKWFNPGSRIFLTNLRNPTYQKFKYLPVSDLIEVFFSLSSQDAEKEEEKVTRRAAKIIHSIWTNSWVYPSSLTTIIFSKRKGKSASNEIITQKKITIKRNTNNKLIF